MTSWLPSFGGLMRRSRSEVTVNDCTPRNPTALSLAQHMSLDLGCMPDLDGQSESLRNEDIQMLEGKLPPRLVGASWRAVFSTSHHGFSLRSLYRKFQSERPGSAGDRGHRWFSFRGSSLESNQRERTLLRDRREFSVHLQTSLELLSLGGRQSDVRTRDFL